jgi:hypothetical protein
LPLRLEQPPRDAQRKAASLFWREQLGVGPEHFARGFVAARACQQTAALEPRRDSAGARRAQWGQVCRFQEL